MATEGMPIEATIVQTSTTEPRCSVRTGIEYVDEGSVEIIVGQNGCVLTDRERRQLIRALGGIPVDPQRCLAEGAEHAGHSASECPDRNRLGGFRKTGQA